MPRSRLVGVILVIAAAVGVGLTAAPKAAAASLAPASSSLIQITGFGANPSNLAMYLYVPDNARPDAPILLALHGCQGSGPYLYSSTDFGKLADQYGFIIIYPSTNPGGSCWDVSSDQALKRNGGSDPVGLMSMITYTEQHYGGNPNAVYVTGESSGGMMTNVMIADYPDVFKAGAAFMGVPYHCFYTGTVRGWNGPCGGGQVSMTPQQWGDLVRNADPGYTGPRPRMQLWHGTADTTVGYDNLGEEIKEWTNVLGVSQTPSSSDTPMTNWNRTRYNNSSGTTRVEAYSIAGAGHQLPIQGTQMAAYAVHFLGLDGSGSTGGTTGGLPTKTVSSTPPGTKPVSSTPSATSATPATKTPASTPSATRTLKPTPSPSATSNSNGCPADTPTSIGSTGTGDRSAPPSTTGCASPPRTDPPGTSGTAAPTPTSLAGMGVAESRSTRPPSPWWSLLLVPVLPAVLWLGRRRRRRARPVRR